MKTHIDSRIYDYDEDLHELLKKTADFLFSYAFALSKCSWPDGSAALAVAEFEVANFATEYLNYYHLLEVNK